MNSQLKYVRDFFKLLNMDADAKGLHSFKMYMEESVANFLDGESKKTAFEVYETFFDCYKIKLEGNKSFIDLLDTVKNYEEKASTLNDKQRDHYIHSVNVFVLGLSVYSQNSNFRKCFKENVYNQKEYDGRYDTSCEEFFFRWGVAALFHDIGYPVEITHNQFNKFVNFVADADGKNDIIPFLGYLNFSDLNSIVEVINKDDFTRNLDDSWKESIFNLYSPIDLLSKKFVDSFGVDKIQMKKALDAYLEYMQKNGYVDHGFYSAIIVLKWYGYLVQESGISSDVLYYPILDAASAILLHNYWRTLKKEPFEIGKVSANRHVIGFLLILCDELQEWNREAYGSIDKKRVLASASNITISEDNIEVHYITEGGTLENNFAEKKEKLFGDVLNMKEIFSNSIKVTCTTDSDLYINKLRVNSKYILPRPLIENLEKMARIIFDRYNETQKLRNPGMELEYPDWNSAPSTIKFSNLRQAKDVFEKIKYFGYIASSEPINSEEMLEFTEEQIECLARIEHDLWFKDREQDGWKYGDIKDVNKKLSPYMVGYDELSEEIKELDRDAVRNAIPLINSIGMKVYKLN